MAFLMRCGSDIGSVLVLLISTEAEGRGGDIGSRIEGIREKAGGKRKALQTLFRTRLLRPFRC